MALNTFRLVAIVVLGLIAWFAFFSEKINENRRRAPAGGAVDPIPDYCMTAGQVAITFDEGPSEYTVGALNGLSATAAVATFHVITKYLNNVAIVTNLEAAYAAGHVIGLRYPNKEKPLTAESDDEIILTLLQESNAIFKVLKVYPKFLRLPYGKYDQRALNIAKSMGFVVTGWNVDTVDYTAGMSVSQLVAPYTAEFGKVPTGLGRYISLHHDIYPIYADAQYVTRTVREITSWGYTPVTLDTCMKTSAYREKNTSPPGKNLVAPPVGEPIAPKSVPSPSDASSFAGSVTMAGVVLAVRAFFGF